MDRYDIDSAYLKSGKFTCWAVFILGIVYAATTLLGFLSLESPQHPIGNPYFTIMEILTLLIAPLMAVSMVAVHFYASPVDRIYSFLSVIFMFLMAGITSCVHFMILSMNLLGPTDLMLNASVFFSFNWLSIPYALDILAWDWFFALSFLLASPVFKGNRTERFVRILMISSGLLSLVGLMGVPLDNVQIRNIGIIGYAIVAPVVYLLIGNVMRRVELERLS